MTFIRLFTAGASRDYFFWSLAMMQVRRSKPSSIDELKAVVEDMARSVPQEMIRDAVENVRKRCQACVEALEGHFESFLGNV